MPDEIAGKSAGDPGWERIDPEQRGLRERRGHGEAVAERPAEPRERAVVRDRCRDEPEPGPGAAEHAPADRRPSVAGDRRPPEEMPVDRPAAVQVEGVTGAVARPAV